MIPFRLPLLPVVLAAWTVLLSGQASAANGDLLAVHTTLSGKRISGISADGSDGTFWALGETTGKIYHLTSNFALIGEMRNPHGTGMFPNLILSRGIAFRPPQTLLVLAKDGARFNVREVSRDGVEVAGGSFAIDTSALPGASLHGLSYDSTSDQIWLIDDQNDLVVRASLSGTVLGHFSFPGDSPAETILRGTGISFLSDSATPYVHITYGDIFTLAPSRVLEMTVNGLSTGVELPLENVPPEEPGLPLKDIGALHIGNVGGREAAVVVGRSGVIHVLERARPSPIPPSFFQGRVTVTNQVVLTWQNHGTEAGGSYRGGITISRNENPPASIEGTLTEYIDATPPPEGVVTYTIRGSNGGPFSVPSRTRVLVGKGGLVGWVPFPGEEPYDLARNPDSGDIYVTDPRGGKIYHLDRNLKFLGFLPSPFEKPGGIAFNPTGNQGGGSLMVGTTEGVLVREISVDGVALDLQVPVDFQPIPSPRMGGLAYDPASKLYTCVEASTRQLVSFDRNGRQHASCTPPEIFTQRLGEGLCFSTLTGNFQATFEDGTVRELFKSCAPTGFGLELLGLGETSFEPNFVRGLEISENTLFLCAPRARALFQVLIFPQGKAFIRGDVDNERGIGITDAVAIAEYIFRAGPAPFCLDAADSNDDGDLDISDPVYLLFYLFLGGPPPPRPFPEAGNDPTFLDNLEC